MKHHPQTLNHVDDFDPARFAVYAYCGTCGHSAPVDPEKVGKNMDVQRLPSRLRCSECGARDSSIRIVLTGAGEFEYREG